MVVRVIIPIHPVDRLGLRASEFSHPPSDPALRGTASTQAFFGQAWGVPSPKPTPQWHGLVWVRGALACAERGRGGWCAAGAALTQTLRKP